MAAKTKQVHTKMSEALFDEVALYATNRGISMPEAVRELCTRALHYDFDMNYTPHIARALRHLENRMVMRFNFETEQALLSMREGTREDVKEIMEQYLSEVDDGW